MKMTKTKSSTELTKKITGVAVLIAIEIVLQTIGNLITFPGGIAINLALIPIAIGAIMYGPFAGALLGFINGLVVLFAPTTMPFWAYSKIGTLVTCLSKCTIAGLISGFLYKLISKKNKFVGSIVSSLVIPIINTTIFMIFFTTVFRNMQDGPGDTTLLTILLATFIGLNFILEFVITTVLSPTIAKITTIVMKEE